MRATGATANLFVQTVASDGHVNMRSCVMSVLGSELEHGKKCGLSFTAIYLLYIKLYCFGKKRGRPKQRVEDGRASAHSDEGVKGMVLGGVRVLF